MKHLYKTKEGEILEARTIDYSIPAIYLDCKNSLVYNGYSDSYAFPLSEVQEVVLDKDGEPFMFAGNPVCLGDKIDKSEILTGWYIYNGSIILITNEDGETYTNRADEVISHTPKHPQKKGIEKMDSLDYTDGIYEIKGKLNQVIDVVNKLKG